MYTYPYILKYREKIKFLPVWNTKQQIAIKFLQTEFNQNLTENFYFIATNQVD